jgi:hypothetical protein
MAQLQKHALLTLFGLVLAALAVAWIQPNTNGGTAFVVVMMVLFANAVGAIVIRSRTKQGGTAKAPAVAPGGRSAAKAKAPRK